jgi:hypothetical protein
MPAVLRVADKPPVYGVYDEIERFERNLADQHGQVVRDFVHVQRTIAPVDGESYGVIDCYGNVPADCSGGPLTEGS